MSGVDAGRVDGVDHWPGLVDPSLPSPRAEVVYNIQVDNNKVLEAAVRAGSWKYVWRSSKCCLVDWVPPPELENPGNMSVVERGQVAGLFHLGTDPEERRDVAGLEEARVEEMRRRLRKHMETVVRGRYPPARGHFDRMRAWTSGWCK